LNDKRAAFGLPPFGGCARQGASVYGESMLKSIPIMAAFYSDKDSSHTGAQDLVMPGILHAPLKNTHSLDSQYKLMQSILSRI
jgi:hypothetical protein